MKRLAPTISLLLSFVASLWAQSEKELPIGFTEWEWENRHLIKEYARETDPPPEPIRNIGEHERMQGVLIRYPLGISTSIVKEMAEDVIVYCLVSASLENSATTSFENAGVNMDSVEFILGSTDSYWTRDYGPWWVVDGDRNVSVVDFTYNRPRPNDNDAPAKMSDYLNTPYFATDLVHAGGNYMTDSYGNSASTSLVYSENEIPDSEVNDIMEAYYGIDTYHVVDDPNGEYIEHIDCWGKFLSPTKLLLREVPESHSQYDEIEEVVEYFESQVNDFGEPWEMYRVYTPNNQPYTNSLILNEKVFVPIVNSSWDDEALEVYQEALPGYEILPVTGDWLSSDAIHCRAKGIPDLEMLQMFHNPINNQDTPLNDYRIVTIIDDLSETGLVFEELKVFWKNSSINDYESILMNVCPEDIPDCYDAYIPGQPSDMEISYYIHAADYSGRAETLPIAGYYSFLIAGFISGDVNMDGTLNVLDVVKIVNHMLATESLSEQQMYLADMNQDGIIDVFDIVELIDLIIG